jgi:hypothetical protein
MEEERKFEMSEQRKFDWKKYQEGVDRDVEAIAMAIIVALQEPMANLYIKYGKRRAEEILGGKQGLVIHAFESTLRVMFGAPYPEAPIRDYARITLDRGNK